MGHLGRDSCPAQVCEAPSHSKVSDLYPRRHLCASWGGSQGQRRGLGERPLVDTPTPKAAPGLWGMLV